MGGGAAMRAAAKVAGIGVVNSGIRGGLSSVPSPAEQSVRNVSRPVSAIISSSQSGNTAGVEVAGVQRPALGLDDWEFAGGEEEQLIEHSEPLPRIVFGPAPSLKEAKEATDDLKDALQKVYLSSPACTKSGSSFGSGQHSALGLLANPDALETRSCITCDPRTSPSCAISAFALLNESPAAQTVVASIASDPNVWDAVWKNESLQEFLQFQKTQSGADAELMKDSGSPKRFTEFSDNTSETGFEDAPQDIFDSIKQSVAEMVNNVSSFVQQIFGFSTEKKPTAAYGDSRSSFFEKPLGMSFMALAVMVIMVVVLKRV